MKVLFVCRGNVGRSQMAMEFYNQIHPGDATSAGTMVDAPGQKLKERGPAVEVVLAMQQLGVDMSENTRTQLTPKMLDDFDKIIVIAQPEFIPSYLSRDPHAEIWDIEDAHGKTVEQAIVIRDEIKRRVDQLAK